MNAWWAYAVNESKLETCTFNVIIINGFSLFPLFMSRHHPVQLNKFKMMQFWSEADEQDGPENALNLAIIFIFSTIIILLFHSYQPPSPFRGQDHAIIYTIECWPYNSQKPNGDFISFTVFVVSHSQETRPRNPGRFIFRWWEFIILWLIVFRSPEWFSVSEFLLGSSFYF